MRKRYNEKVENVDFEKLRKCLKDRGIKQRELSIVCGYYPDYIKKALRKHVLNKHVSNVLTYAYKIDPSEYIDTQPKEVTISEEDDDMYTLTFSIHEQLLKRLAMQSMKEHITIDDLVTKIIIKGIDEKILEEKQ